MSSSTCSAGPPEQPPPDATGPADPLELTPYAIRSIHAGDDIPPPLLQLLSFEKIIGDPNDNDRYKLVLSDGTCMQVAILPTKYADLLHAEMLKIGSILLLTKYTCRYVWNTRVVIVFTLDVKKTDYHLLGKPRYLFKEQEEQMLGRETPPPTKRALKFGVDLPSPQNGTVKDVNKVYNKLNNQLEIILTETSVLKRCALDAVGPDKKTRFTPTDELLTTTNNTLIDVIGVVVNVGEISVIRRKDGSVVNKRIVKINDMSTLTIDVNLWGPSSEQLGNDLKNMHTSGTFVILVVQNARVGCFNGKVINASASIAFEINPSIPEAEPLRLRGPIQQSLDPHPSALHCKNNQYQRMSIASILQCLSVMPEAIETTITTVLRFIKEDPFYYTACPLQFNGKELSTDTFNSERRIKVTIDKMQRLDFKAESTCLLAEIAQMHAVT
ncbi:hypothetical protein SUGI_0306560 [Cryptomeria japonica]|nr:hypothetical protein SUGI_0306560 [Cryptomeria japonica]